MNNIISREIDLIKKEKLADQHKLKIKKEEVINELKSGLGKIMKENPSKITIIKIPWYKKIGIMINKFFIKF